MDEVIRLYRAEEQKLNQAVRQYKDILYSMKICIKKDRSEPERICEKDDDITLKERQEVELLDQVLKKALKIRRNSPLCSGYQEKPCSSVRATWAPDIKDGNKRNSQKSSSHSQVKGNLQHTGQLKSTAGLGDAATRQVLVKASCRSTIIGKKSGTKPLSTRKAATVDVQMKSLGMVSSLETDRGSIIGPSSSSDERKSYSDPKLKMQNEGFSSEAQWVHSPFLPLWLKQRVKKNKLWNKVLTGHSEAAPERDHFQKRLISTFPPEWASVHIAAMKAELNDLTQLGLDLSYCFNTKLNSHQRGWSPDPSREKEYESLIMLENLEKMMVHVVNESVHLKKDWERKMAWWQRALCPLHNRLEWHKSERSCLPPILAYSSEGELEDLHKLRLDLTLLKLEIHMHQAICDTLSDQISGESSSGCPNATVLRGLYSILGGGGAQFSSLVLDINSAQT